ncbi:MAG: hypothetical protein A2659_01345 [Candidatus Yanofskybacteria bacterium RIFCSPHIGHO2_01_FULL_44_24]|nr:MAG: hypothetical protein A2659_01345 [Candidatus Yanofskybacteria bacterium RIFCSPHIGHO2_01_FULL_44_24]
MTKTKLVIIIVVISALVLLGWGGYNFWAKKAGAPQLPGIPSLITSERSLQGIWTVKEVYLADTKTGELKLLPLEESGKKDSYLEFKGDMFCNGGQLDSYRKPYPCPKYLPFSVSGDKIKIEDPSQTITASWEFVSGNLELILELPPGEGGKIQKLKFVLTEL